jgi:lysophospholipase L1-like esterase
MSTNYTGKYPAQVVGAMVGMGAQWCLDNVEDMIAAYDNIGYACVSIGTNDANAGAAGLAAFESDLRDLVNAFQTAGIKPMLARIPYTNNGAYGGGGPFGADDTALYNEVIDEITASNELSPGPDLYQISYDNYTTWYENGDGGDSVHPGREGCRQWNAAWAAAVANDIESTIMLSSALTASGTLAGNPTVAVELSSALTASGTLAGDPTIVTPVGLTTDIAASGVLGSDLTYVGPIYLESSLTASGVLGGDLTVQGLEIELTSDLAATAVLTGDLTIVGLDVDLSSDISASVTLAGDLTVYGGLYPLAADIVASGTLAGTLAVVEPSLLPLCTVTGIILDAAGDPVSGAVVTITPTTPQAIGGKYLHGGALEAETNDAGEFSIALAQALAAYIRCEDVGLTSDRIYSIPSASSATLDEILDSWEG